MYSNSLPQAQLVKGAAANIFQKNAMGKFLISVPAQMAGSCHTGAPPKIMLKIMVAARLMVGHITDTVPACRINRQK